MRQRIYLYIGNELVDLDNDSFILLNLSREEMTNPTAYLNSWSQAITLPNTENNNNILGHYYRLDHRTVGSGGTGVNFSALKRTPFTLYDDTGIVLMRGYIKLEKAEGKGFSITLYGGLGKFFFDLTYDGAGNKLTLADCPYRVNTTWYHANQITIRCARSAVLNAWGALRYGAPASGTEFDIINFIPCLNGTQYPFKFDTNKAAYREGNDISLQYPDLYTSFHDSDTGKNYEPYNGESTVILQMGQKHNEWEVQDLRSYCQRPAISLRMMMEGIQRYAFDQGYTLNYDSDFFNDDCTYLQRVWMTLPFVDRDNLTDVQMAQMTAADFLKGTKTPAEYLIGIAKTFGFVFETSPDGQTIQMRLRQTFYWGHTTDLTERIDVESISVKPYAIDARYYDWQTEMAGIFCSNYEKTYGRKYGSLRLDTGYDFDTNTKVVTSLPWNGCADVRDINANYVVWVGHRNGASADSYLYKFALSDTVKWTLYYLDPDGVNPDESKDFTPLELPNYGSMFYSVGVGDAGVMWLPLPQLHDDGGKALEDDGVLLFYEGMSDVPNVTTGGGIVVAEAKFHLSDDTTQMLDANGQVPCWDVSLPGSGANVTAITWIPSFRRWHFNGATMQLSLDWGDPLIRPAGSGTFLANKGLYENYWSAYMADRLDQDSQVMTCKVNLEGLQVSDALFRDFYYYGGSKWVLNKIINHSVTTLGLTDCEFIRVQAVAAYSSGQLTF